MPKTILCSPPSRSDRIANRLLLAYRKYLAPTPASTLFRLASPSKIASLALFGLALPSPIFFLRGKIGPSEIGVVVRPGGELATTSLGASLILTVAVAALLIATLATSSLTGRRFACAPIPALIPNGAPGSVCKRRVSAPIRTGRSARCRVWLIPPGPFDALALLAHSSPGCENIH